MLRNQNRMSPRLVGKTLLEAQLTRGFVDLAGTDLTGDIELPGEWINRHLADLAASGKTAPVVGASVAFLDDNRAVLLLVLDRFPLPRRVEVPIAVSRISPDPSGAAVELGLEPAPWLRIVLPLLASRARAQGLRWEGNRLVLRLADLVGDPRIEAILRHVRALQWSTSPGCLIVRFEWNVEAPVVH